MPEVKITINHSEQQRVERQLLINQLSQDYQPVEMVDNVSMGKMVKVGRVMAKRGFRKLKGAAKSGAGFAQKQGRAAVIQTKRAGLRAKKFAKSPAGKMTAVGAAAAGGASLGSTISGRARRKRSKNSY
jgi:hypothetical protein